MKVETERAERHRTDEGQGGRNIWEDNRKKTRRTRREDEPERKGERARESSYVWSSEAQVWSTVTKLQ